MDYNDHDPGPTQKEQAWIDRCKELEAEISDLETDLEGAHASEKEAWEKRRLYFHERNEEATRRIAQLEARQQELLQTLVNVTHSTPFPDEWEEARHRVGILIAEVGALRARVKELEGK